VELAQRVQQDMIPIAVAPHDRRLQPGGTVVEPGREKWGSYGGSFADPGGYLLCVGVGAGQPIAAE
jgi:hypothetical protein